MSLLALAAWWVLDAQMPDADNGSSGLARELTLVAVPVGLGAAAYLGALHVWGVEELTLLRRATLGRVFRRFAA